MKKNYVPIVLITGIFLLVTASAWCGDAKLSDPRRYPKELVVAGKTFVLEIADLPEQQIQGLSDRPYLPENQGMLFIFPEKEIQTFWMYRMRFPLDILWIDDGKVVKIDKNIPPEGDQPQNRYASDRPVNRVLEINAGLADKYHIKEGDTVFFK